MISCWNSLIGFRWPARRLRHLRWGSGMKHLFSPWEKWGETWGKSMTISGLGGFIKKKRFRFPFYFEFSASRKFWSANLRVVTVSVPRAFSETEQVSQQGPQNHHTTSSPETPRKCQTHLEPLTASRFPATRLNSSQRSCDPSWSIMRNHYHQPLTIIESSLSIITLW